MTGTDRQSDRLRLRASFDDIADLYARVRPGYPVAVLDDLAELGGAKPGARVLEIGCGTGQLTLPLARRGCRLVAVELGANLAAIARTGLAADPDGRRVEVVVADFDCWTPAGAGFDLVVAATAFHWLDPRTRLNRIAALLRPGGAVGVVATFHVAGGSSAFFADVQDCYQRWDAATPAIYRLPAAEDIGFDHDLERGGLFGPITFRRHIWEAGYSTAQYLDLLRTYSTVLALPPRTRHGLLHDIGRLIDTRYGGRIVKRYQTELRVAVSAK